MRGQIVSAEYQRIVFVRDENGGQYACYAKDLNDPDRVSDDEKAHCLNISQVLGDNW
jgi:hypothetical protein